MLHVARFRVSLFLALVVAVGVLMLRRVQGDASKMSGIIPEEAQRWVDDLGLAPQKYGNWLKESYTSDIVISDLPPRFAGGSRKLSDDIYNLYARHSDNASLVAGFPLHMLMSDEMWIYHAGDGPLTLFLFDLENKSLRNVTVGNTPGALPQFVVKHETWIGMLLERGTTWALTGAQNTPAFDPRDSFMAGDNATIVARLYATFPEQRHLIDTLLSFPS